MEQNTLASSVMDLSNLECVKLHNKYILKKKKKKLKPAR